jgi:alkyl hydroperoxide reductase subunit AhpF
MRRQVLAEALVIATGAVARRLHFPGAGDSEYWQKGISACAVCDGAIPMFRNKPLAVMCVPMVGAHPHVPQQAIGSYVRALVVGCLIVGWRMAGMMMPHAAAGAVIRPWRRRCS